MDMLKGMPVPYGSVRATSKLIYHSTNAEEHTSQRTELILRRPEGFGHRCRIEKSTKVGKVLYLRPLAYPYY
jgi:hypothetical protein